MSATLPSDATPANSLLALACLLLVIALPVCAFYYLMSVPANVLAASIGLSASNVEMAATHRALVIAIASVPVGCIAVALIHARRCFLTFARRDYFTPQIVNSLRGFAGATFFSAVAGVAAAPLASLALAALRDEPGSVSVNVSSSQLLLLVFAAIVWQIAAVMNKAVALAEENQQFV